MVYSALISMSVKTIIVSVAITALVYGLLFIQPSSSAQDNKTIYHQGWIDLNKNGRMDVYENQRAPINARVEDLLRQMNLNEKTCQTATLYGVGRGRTGQKAPLEDELPTPEWRSKLWKDGIANIDEHLNGVGPNGKSVYATDIAKHVWAMNEVQRFFIEQTRLGIPVDFTNEGLRGVAFSTATSFPSELGQGHTWESAVDQRDWPHHRRRSAGARLHERVRADARCFARPALGTNRRHLMARILILFRAWVLRWPGRCRRTIASPRPAKHYAVYSVGKGAREGQARTDRKVTRHEVENILLPPFKAAIKDAHIPRRDEFIQRL
jgi:beta-glucosidase